MFYRAIFHHKQFRYLGAFYLHSTVRLFAVSIFSIFSGIYIFQTIKLFNIQTSHALAFTSLILSLMFLVNALSIPPTVWLISKKGLRLAVFWGSMALVAFFIILYFAKFDPIFFIIAAVCGGLQAGLYWTAYHIYFAELTDDKNQGEEVSVSMALQAVVAIGGPAFGGLIISYGGFGAVFLAMVVLMLIAIFPLKYLPVQRDTVSIDIVQIFSALNPKTEFKSLLSFLGFFTAEFTYLTFWPIFILPFLGSLEGVGFMGSLIALCSSVATIVIGFLVDKFGAKRVINIAAPLDSIILAFLAFVSLPWQIFLIAGTKAISASAQIVSIDSLVYERARHQGFMAYIVQREIGGTVGRFLYLLVLGILLWFGLPLIMVFVISAAMALLSRLYPETSTKDQLTKKH